MQEIKSIISKYDELQSSGLRMAMAVVINVEQSSYRRSGARMLITSDGQWTGGISGGCLEGDTLQKAKLAIHTNKPTKVTYDTREGDTDQIGVGLGCNGLIDVFITPIDPLNISPISALRQVVQRREPSILVTNLETGQTTDVTEQNDKLIEVSNLIAEVRSKGKSIFKGEYFVEFIHPAISMFVFGKNYDVIPLAQISKTIGWNVYIVANPLKVNTKLFNTVDKVYSSSAADIPFDHYSVALLMAHDYNTDLKNLSKLQPHKLKYIGLLGPKSRTEKIVGELKSENINICTDNLYGPMGIDTGATSPEEIAISIISEIRAVFSERKGGLLRDRKGSIH